MISSEVGGELALPRAASSQRLRDPCQLLSTHGLSRRALPVPRQRLTSAGLARPGSQGELLYPPATIQGLASPPLHPMGSPASRPGHGDGALK